MGRSDLNHNRIGLKVLLLRRKVNMFLWTRLCGYETSRGLISHIMIYIFNNELFFLSGSPVCDCAGLGVAFVHVSFSYLLRLIAGYGVLEQRYSNIFIFHFQYFW